MTTLYLCEKPRQARDIARVLGANKKQACYLEGHNYIVTWCIGHLIEMAPPEYYRQDLKPWRLEALPVIPTTWHRQVSDRTKKQFNAVKKLLKQSNHVVIATDADREGVRHEVALKTCFHIRRKPPMSLGESRGMNQELP